MEKFEILFKQSVAKDLRQIPKKEVARILKRIDKLQIEPRPAGVEKLSGQEKYRVRHGVYRIIYEISKKAVFIHCILDGRRDLQDLLERRLLR